MKTSQSLFDDTSEKKSLEAERAFEAEMAVRRRTMVKICVPLGILLALGVGLLAHHQYALARKRAANDKKQMVATETTETVVTEAGYEAAPLKLTLFTDSTPPQEIAALLVEASDRRPSTIRVEMRHFTSLPDGDPLIDSAGQRKIVLRAVSSLDAHTWEKTMELGKENTQDLTALINEWHLDLFPDRGAVFPKAIQGN